MKSRTAISLFGILLIFVTLISWQSAKASQKILVPTDGTKTIKLGKQGLFLSNLPTNVRFVEIERIKPPLRPAYTHNVEIAYRGPALDITFLNENLAAVSPLATLSSVYFNLSEPEVGMWTEGGVNNIAIWFYNKKSEEWRMCPPRLIAEKLNNGKYDRLACFVMGNGIYVLGKMEFDPFFPLWFKPHDKSVPNSKLNFVQEYR